MIAVDAHVLDVDAHLPHVGEQSRQLTRPVGQLYGDADEPVLLIDDLKHEVAPGSIATESRRDRSAIFADFSDILGSVFGLGGIFGGGRRGRGVAAGRDLRFELEIDFEEAVRRNKMYVKQEQASKERTACMKLAVGQD